MTFDEWLSTAKLVGGRVTERGDSYRIVGQYPLRSKKLERLLSHAQSMPKGEMEIVEDCVVWHLKNSV